MPGGGLVSREQLTAAWRAYLAAAESGHVASMWRVTESYFTGDLAAPDPVRALEWFNRAAAVTSTSSLFDLGRHLMADAAVANKRRALLLLDAAAQRGHPEATFHVGNAYAQGIAVDGAPARHFKDMKKAGDYWEKAARLGWGPAKPLITSLLRKRQTRTYPHPMRALCCVCAALMRPLPFVFAVRSAAGRDGFRDQRRRTCGHFGRR